MIVKLKSLKNHQGFMKYFKNTSWLFAEKILRMVVGLFVGVWVARYLGPDKFGLFSYTQSFVGLFTAIATLGLDGIVVRELVKHPQKENELLSTAFYLKLMGAVLTLVILYIAIHFTSNDHYTNVLIFIIASATIFQSFNVIDMYFQSKVMSKYVVYANITSLFISSLVKITLILLNAPLIAFAWVVLFDSFVLACGFIYFFLKQSALAAGNTFRCKIQNLKFSKLTAISLLKDSWPLVIGGMSFVVFSNIDNIMIKELLNNHAVGIYSASYRLVTLWYFLPGLVLGSLLPAIINAQKQQQLFYNRIQYISSLLLWIGIFISIIYTVFSKQIINITYGKAYSEASSLLIVLVWVNVLIFFNSSWNKWMMIENKMQRTLMFHIVVAILNIILNFYLIKQYGVIGAAYALLSSLIITYIIFFTYYKNMFYMFLSSISFGKIKGIYVRS